MNKYRKVESRLLEAFFVPAGCDEYELRRIAPPEFLQCQDWQVYDGVLLRIGGYLSGDNWELPLKEAIWVVFDGPYLRGYSIKDFQKNFIAG